MGKANATFEVITKYVGNTLLIQSSPRYDTVSFLWLIGNKDWENSTQLCKPETKSKVCITVSNVNVCVLYCICILFLHLCFSKAALKDNS